MAKVDGGLFSLNASGQFGKALVFDKRGRVRQYKVPANPQSADQGDARQRLAAVQAALKISGPTAIAAMQAVAPIGYLWNSNMVKEAIGTGAANYTAGHNAFIALAGADQTAWKTAFADVLVPRVDYATIDPVSGGEAAFILARALFDSGAITTPGTPVGGNSAAWHAAMIA